MARVLKEATITTKSARAKLPDGTHWRAIDGDIHLGYRKGKRGGQWIVRWYVGDQRYQQATLPKLPDDVTGVGTLDYQHAITAAREHVEQARMDAAATAAGPVLTVRDAVKAYVKMRDAREIARTNRAIKSDAHRLAKYVLPADSEPKELPDDDELSKWQAAQAALKALADKPVHKLTKADLVAWRATLTGKTATRRRIGNDFKAALNDVAPDELKPIIKAGLKQPKDEAREDVARDNQILTDNQVRKLIEGAYAVDDDFGRLVMLLAATGACFSQVIRLRVRDVQAARIMIPASHKGRALDTVKLPIPTPVGADVIAALKPALEGRSPNDPLLERWRHVQISATEWKRDRRGAWTDSAEMTRPFNAIAKAAGITGISAYALRHSSIVRGLRHGLPVQLVAKWHDTSVAMIERHYGKYIATALEDMARAAIIPMVAAA